MTDSIVFIIGNVWNQTARIIQNVRENLKVIQGQILCAEVLSQKEYGAWASRKLYHTTWPQCLTFVFIVSSSIYLYLRYQDSLHIEKYCSNFHSDFPYPGALQKVKLQ